jgi:flavin reductase (DIM6/NTAB) family NADH-FMN oxidoreductase RutF
MSTKPTGLAQFTANHKGGAAGAVPVAAAVTASVAPPVVQVAAPEAPRQRGKSDQVALTLAPW